MYFESKRIKVLDALSNFLKNSTPFLYINTSGIVAAAQYDGAVKPRRKNVSAY